MAQFIRTEPQTLAAVGDTITYTQRNYCCNRSNRNRVGTGSVVVNGGGNCRNPVKYRINFHGNVTGVAGTIQLVIYQDNDMLPETLMSVVPAAAADVWSVNAETEICAYGCNSTISVRTLTPGVTVNTASLIVE